MKRKAKKRIMAVLMAVMMCVICPLAEVNATSYNYLLNEKGEFDGGDNTTANYSFSSEKQQEVTILIAGSTQAAFNMSIENLDTENTSNLSFTETDWEYNSDLGSYITGYKVDLENASYMLSLSSTESFSYQLIVAAASATISDTSATITAGQKKTLKITGATGTVTWSSNKTSIATVSSKGVVTAKKAGTAIITALVDGNELTCKIVVKKNVYTAAKLTTKNAKAGVSANVHKAYYKSGKLVCQLNIVNNSSYKVKKLPKVQITAKTSAGKIIAKQSFNKSGVSIKSNSQKTLTLTISKKYVKNKKADLRSAEFSISGKYVYSYY